VNIRLAAAGLAALALAAAVVFAGYWRLQASLAAAERDKARAALSVALDANASLEAALARARAQAEINDRIMVGVAAELAKITEAIAGQTAAIAELGEQNEEVRSYLAGIVPGALELQLNR